MSTIAIITALFLVYFLFTMAIIVVLEHKYRALLAKTKEADFLKNSLRPMFVEEYEILPLNWELSNAQIERLGHGNSPMVEQNIRTAAIQHFVDALDKIGALEPITYRAPYSRDNQLVGFEIKILVKNDR